MNLEYWKKRCLLAERIIDESPHDKNTLPTVAKLNAAQEWANHIAGEKRNRTTSDERIGSFVRNDGCLSRDMTVYATPLINVSKKPNKLSQMDEELKAHMDILSGAIKNHVHRSQEGSLTKLNSTDLSKLISLRREIKEWICRLVIYK